MEIQFAKEKRRRKVRVETDQEKPAKVRGRAYQEYEDFAASLNQISDRDIEHALVERHVR